MSEISSFQAEAKKVLDHLHSEYAKLQTGRASAALVEGISVEAYGARQPIKALASISVQDAKSLVISPWDKGVMQNIERALQEANIGVMPVNDGVVLRLTLPSMTEERRQQMTKIVQQLAEEARISIRQTRQAHHDRIKANEKDEDARYTSLDGLQKEVDAANDKVEEMMKKKVEEVMTV